MRKIFLDLETTGIQRSDGHRVIEIAMLECIDDKLTGVKFTSRFNPQRDVPEYATKVNGIKTGDLIFEPLFEQKSDLILDFIKDSPLIAHNAKFDMKFLNHELNLCGKPQLPNRVICTMEMAKSSIKGVKYNLNSLCDYFGFDRSHRDIHGALIDCELLAKVYFALILKGL